MYALTCLQTHVTVGLSVGVRRATWMCKWGNNQRQVDQRLHAMLSAQTSSLYMSHYQARTHNKTTQRSTGHRIHREHSVSSPGAVSEINPSITNNVRKFGKVWRLNKKALTQSDIIRRLSSAHKWVHIKRKLTKKIIRLFWNCYKSDQKWLEFCNLKVNKVNTGMPLMRQKWEEKYQFD